MMTDPIADMLTRIRNAVRVERPAVAMPLSKVKRGVAEVLKREGYIWDWQAWPDRHTCRHGPASRAKWPALTLAAARPCFPAPS